MKIENVYILFQGMQVMDVFETAEKAEIRANVLMEHESYIPVQTWFNTTIKAWASSDGNGSKICIIRYQIN